MKWICLFLFCFSVKIFPAEDAPSYALYLKEEAKKIPDRSWTVGILSTGKSTFFYFGKAKTSSLFRIGALTETFTGALLSQYVAEGKVKGTDRAQDYMPDGVWLPTYNGHEITLNDLATHTSGLSDIFIKENWAKMTGSEILEEVNQLRLHADPGSRYLYSRLGYALLTMALDKISGRSWSQQCVDVLCNPLGLMSIQCFPKKSGLILKGHNEKGQAIDSLKWFPENSNFLGVMGLYANIQDMVEWMRFQLGEGDTSLNFLLPIQQNTCRKNSCIGWQALDEKDSRIFICRSKLWGYSACMTLFPEENLGVVLMSDGDIDSDSIAIELLERMKIEKQERPQK